MANLVFRGPGNTTSGNASEIQAQATPLTSEQINKNFWGLNFDINQRVAKSGDSMTGTLTIGSTITLNSNGNFSCSGTGTVTGLLTTTAGITLNNVTSNVINFGTAGLGIPTFTTRSVGTKVLLYQALSASSGDVAIGVATNTLWLSVPTSNDSFALFAGTTNIASFKGNNGTNTTYSSMTLNDHVVYSGVINSSNSTTLTAIAEFDATIYRSANITVQAVQGTNYHTASLLALHNGTTADSTEYGTLILGSTCGVFSVVYDTDKVVLQITPASASLTTYKVFMILSKI